MPLPNQSPLKSAVANLREILKTWPEAAPESSRLLSEFEATLLDLEEKIKPQGAQSLVMPGITASISL